MDVVMIAHFVTEFCPEGTSRFVYIAERLSRQHHVELITSGFDHIKKQQREQTEFSLNTKVTLLPEPSYPRNVCLQRFLSHRSFGRQVKVYLEQRQKPDVIYCAVPSLDCAYFAAQFARKNGIRFIVDVQDLWPEAFKMVLPIPVVSDLLFLPMKKMADRIYAAADAVAGVSDTYCTRALAADRERPAAPVFLGTRLDVFDRHAAAYGEEKPEENFRLGYCGTLGHSYDIKCVLDAMAILREQGVEDLELWIMGDGPLEDTFRCYAREKNVNVTFRGRVPYEQMCGLLTSCHVCVNPIVADSAASIINKHGDYAAAGLPVINTQPSAEYRSLVEQYGCGINCAPGDARAVAQAIAFLKEDRQARTEMGLGARRLAEERFDRERAYGPVLDLVCCAAGEVTV